MFLKIELIEWIEMFGILVAIIFGVVSCFISKKSNKISNDANMISSDSMRIAKEANVISENALKLSEEANNFNKENIQFESIFNPVIIKNNSFIQFENDKDYSDYFLLLSFRANNLSLQPVTIKNFSLYIGKGKEKKYFYIGDLVKIKSYKAHSKTTIPKNLNQFPLYLNGNECKEFIAAVGLSDSDRLQYHNKGVEVEFETTNSRRQISVDESNTIEYL